MLCNSIQILFALKKLGHIEGFYFGTWTYLLCNDTLRDADKNKVLVGL